MATFILDASVAVKWFFSEKEQDISMDFYRRVRRKEIKVVVPDLFYLEMSNVCWTRFRKQVIGYDYVSAVIKEIAMVPFERYSDKELAVMAFENAARFGISVYDGVYLALAEIYAAPLITADEGILTATKNRFDFVLPLKEFGRGLTHRT